MGRKQNDRMSFCQRLVQGLDSTDTPKMAREQNERMPFCQPLVRALDRVDAAAVVNTESRLMSLPTEIRQSILDHILDDMDLLHAGLKKGSTRIKLVCKTFQSDSEWVLKKWKLRKEGLTNDCSSYLADILAPVLAARKALIRAVSLKGSSKGIVKRHGELRRENMKRVNSVRPEFKRTSSRPTSDTTSWHQTRWSAHSAAEAESIAEWSKLRADRIQKVKEEGKAADRAFQEERRLQRDLERNELKLAGKKIPKRLKPKRQRHGGRRE